MLHSRHRLLGPFPRTNCACACMPRFRHVRAALVSLPLRSPCSLPRRRRNNCTIFVYTCVYVTVYVDDTDICRERPLSATICPAIGVDSRTRDCYRMAKPLPNLGGKTKPPRSTVCSVLLKLVAPRVQVLGASQLAYQGERRGGERCLSTWH